YIINAAKLLAVGGVTNFGAGIYSSAPDLRTVVVGQPVTFTAVVTNSDPAGSVPTGTVTFQDVTFQSSTRVTNVLAADVPLTNGLATVTTSALLAGGNYQGNHFITALYAGDSNFPPASATLVQKVHASGTTTSISASPPSSTNTVTLTATVAAVSGGT